MPIWLTFLSPWEEQTLRGKSYVKADGLREDGPLQELLAPKFVTFYDQDWIDVGTKHSLQHLISDATGIDTSHLFEHY